MATLHRSLVLAAALIANAAAPAGSAELRVLANRPLASFIPSEAFGVAVDGGSAAESTGLIDPRNGQQIRATRFGRVSYRLRTELAGEVWHWSEYGRWSDPARHEGYWIGDAARNDDSELTYGYRLPRRGNSRDEANDDGFSRLDDGDVATYWKSNPYLDPKLDGLGSERQWVIVDLGRSRQINAARIEWGNPYAAQFRVQRWVGEDEYDGQWKDLTQALRGHAGSQPISFKAAPTRYVRILLERSSHTAEKGSNDPRDAMGYAIRELALGLSFRSSEIRDYIRHVPSGLQQSQVHVSSTDPWHRQQDRDPDLVQPSPLALHQKSLFAGPFTIPLGLLTDTPENALAELRFFYRRGLPIDRVELGEEPEGQWAPPRAVAALYDRLASRLATEFPKISIGGPSLIDPVADTTLDDKDPSWTRAFLETARGLHSTIGYLSTELYPIENLCAPRRRILARVAQSPQKMSARLREDGAGSLPQIITEYGLSPYGGRALIGLTAALADAEILAGSLSHGVSGLYLYGTSPTSAVAGERNCAGWGNLSLWSSDRLGRIHGPSLRLQMFQALRDTWSNPHDAREEMLAVAGAPTGVDAFALRRDDGSVALLLINRTSRSISVDQAARRSVDGFNIWRTIVNGRLHPGKIQLFEPRPVLKKSWPAHLVMTANSALIIAPRTR